jgi:hypothetical protein
MIPKTMKISKIGPKFSELSKILVPPFQRGTRHSREGFNPSVASDSSPSREQNLKNELSPLKAESLVSLPC